ncbi:sugar ABC transporter ATP-binding protein [soil metagenome]
MIRDMPASPAIEIRDVSMQFPAVRALDSVSLSLSRGEVHGLIGENGAGKSTLMKILSGLQRPTSGQIVVDGQPVQLQHPIDAQKLGIVMIHQELNLVDELSVADNIFLGREPGRFGWVDGRLMRTAASELLTSLDSPLSPRAKVRSLSIAQQQMVEIAKAVSQKARVLIMDEPTAVLTARETKALFALIERLKQTGVTIVYISHILPEVLQVCDRITVMRDGKIVKTLDDPRAENVTERQLASLMVGREMSDFFPPRNTAGSEVVLSIKNLSVPGHVSDVSFDLHAGEILGFAGLIGAGRTEMAEAIAGLRRKSAGAIYLAPSPGIPGEGWDEGSVTTVERAASLEQNPHPSLSRNTERGEENAPIGRTGVSPALQEIKIHSPRDAVAAGIAYMSEDRKSAGLSLDLSIVHNTTLVSLPRYGTVWLSRHREEAATRRHVKDLEIKTGRLRDPVRSLSGGNQQKVLLAKWLETSPRVLIIDEPTRGVDIGAKRQIYGQIAALTARGMACILISSELNEVLGLSHRVAVMRNGKLQIILEARDATEQTVMNYAAGVTGKENGTADELR